MKKGTVVPLLAMGLVAALLVLVPAASQAASSPEPTQTELIASYTVVGGGSPPAPILNYFHNNVLNQTTLHAYQQTLFVDLGSTWSVTQPPGANSSSERWYTASAVSGPIYGFTTVSIVYYHQYSVGFGYSVVGGSSGAGAPQVAFNFDGRHATAPAGGRAWADAGFNFTYPQLTTGSSLQQRWVLNSSVAGSIQGPENFTATYLHQDSFELNYAVHGGNATQVPALSGTSFGLPISVQLGVNPSVTWMDAGSRFSITNPLSPSDSQVRWFAGGKTSGVALAPENFTLRYYRQESFTAYYSVVNGSAPSPPTIVTTSFGSESPQYLTTNPTVYWSDLGSHYGFPSVLVGSSSTERWVIADNATGSVSPGLVLHVTYYHQYLLTLRYKQPATTGFIPPVLRADSLGSIQNVSMAGSGVSFWADNGTALVPMQLAAQNQAGRWGMEGPIPTMLEGPLNASISFVYQYPFQVSYSVSGGANPAPPLLYGTSSGKAIGANLTAQGSTFWLDRGTPWSVQAVLPGPSPGERWTTSQTYGGNVSSRTSLSVQYALQYYVGVGSGGAGGNSSVPSGWYNAGSSLKLSFSSSPGWIFLRWEGSGAGSYTGSESSPVVLVNGTLRETPLVYATLQIFTTRGGTVSYVNGTGLHTVKGSNVVVEVLPGSNVTLVANPSFPVYSFSGWSGAGGQSGPRIAVAVDGISQITAEFSINYLAVGALVVLAAFLVVGGFAFWKARRRWMPGIRAIVRGARKIKR